jgi:hypothetical protein
MAKGIYRRGNIYWIRYAGLDGRTVYESSGSEKFRDAEALLIVLAPPEKSRSRRAKNGGSGFGRYSA